MGPEYWPGACTGEDLVEPVAVNISTTYVDPVMIWSIRFELEFLRCILHCWEHPHVGKILVGWTGTGDHQIFGKGIMETHIHNPGILN